MKENQFIERRGMLLAELFLQKLKPLNFLQETGSDRRLDYLLGFRTGAGRIVVIGVEVKSTDEPVPNPYQFYLAKPELQALTDTNLTILVVVVDVKKSEAFFGWGSQIEVIRDPTIRGAAFVQLPVRKATPSNTQRLLQEIKNL
jgi:hypothetical protein